MASVEQAQEAAPSTEVPSAPPEKKPQVAYQIGKLEDGKVTLRLGDYYGSTVTMNNAGVDQLIRMLEAAKDPENRDQTEPTDS